MHKSFAISLSIHAALISLFFIHLNWARHDNIGAHTKIIAYLYHQQLLAHQQTQPSSLPVREQALKNNLASSPSRIAVNSKNQPAEQPLGEPNELLTSLHNMIENAIKRSGFSPHQQKIQVGFMLFPDGHIANIHLLEPSESASLNSAVIKAVNAIQPVIAAHNFLSAPHEFKIQIIFDSFM